MEMTTAKTCCVSTTCCTRIDGINLLSRDSNVIKRFLGPAAAFIVGTDDHRSRIQPPRRRENQGGDGRGVASAARAGVYRPEAHNPVRSGREDRNFLLA